MENENRLAVWYDRTIGKVIPRAHFFAMLFLPLFNILLYSLTMSLMLNVPRGSIALPIDGKIPLIEEWVLIYFGCYAFWFGGLGLPPRPAEPRMRPAAMGEMRTMRPGTIISRRDAFVEISIHLL